MTGLIGWWPLHENSGSTARDLSGNGNNGSLSGSVTQGVAGKGGLTAYGFDGSDDSIDYGDVNIVEGRKEFTISVWIYPESTVDEDKGIAASGAYSGNYHWSWTLTADDRVTFTVYEDDGTNDGRKGLSTSSGSVSTGKWHHVTALYRGGSFQKIYIDGELSAETTSGVPADCPDTSYSMVVGETNNQDFGRKYYDGRIADFRFYDRILSPQEIQTLYEWGSGDYTDKTYHDGSDSGAVSRWKFDGDVTDSWGSNDGNDNTSAGYSNDAVRGQAKKFDGTDDYINLGNPSNLNFGSADFTIASWFKADSSSERILNNRTNNTSGYGFFVNGSNQITFLVDNGGTNEGVSSNRGVLGDWHHAAAVRSSGTINLYLDEALVDTTASSGDASSSEDAIIGAFNDSGTLSNYWPGEIDDLRIYSRALSLSEVFQLYQWGTRGRDMRKLTLNARGG